MPERTALTNQVHSIVSRERFSDPLLYDIVFIRPARLVSHLLQTPQAVHYFLAIIHSAPHQSELEIDPAGKKRYRYHELEDIHDLRASDYTLVARTLDRVARTVTWDVCTTTGYAEITSLPRDTSTGSFLSARSKIDINVGFLLAFVQLDDFDQFLNLQFLLAVTMVHVIAHATLHALTEVPREHVFGESGSGEAGWELEARLFGPCVSEEKKFSGELWWYELGVGKDKHLQPTPVDRVKIGFVKRLFTDWFWSHRFDRQGPWKIIPSVAWPPVVYVPDSVAALIQAAMTQVQRRRIAKVKSSSKKRKRNDEDE